MAESTQTTAAAHLDISGVNCGRGQVVELFACRNKVTGEFYRFGGTYSNRSREISAGFQPTWYTREEVKTVRKNLPSTEDYYQGVSISTLEWVRFSLSESPETL